MTKTEAEPSPAKTIASNGPPVAAGPNTQTGNRTGAANQEEEILTVCLEEVQFSTTDEGKPASCAPVTEDADKTKPPSKKASDEMQADVAARDSAVV